MNISKNFLLLFLINIIFLELPCASANSLPKSKDIEKIIVYFNSPTDLREARISNFNISFFSEHAIYVGNRHQIEELNNILNSTIINAEKDISKRSRVEVWFKVLIYSTNKRVFIFFANADRRFEYGEQYLELKKGIMKKEQFNELLKKCMQLIDIIDLKAQEKIISE